MSSDDIYIKYNIDKSKLKRDYILNPLKKINNKTPTNKFYREYEHIDKDDLYYLYIICRLSIRILGNEIFLIQPNNIKRQLNIYNIKKSQKQIQLDRKYTNLLKYGVENVMMVDNIKEKMYKTNLIKYGHKSSMGNKSVIHKQYLTKKKNNTFNTSKPEEEIYKLLVEKFGEVKRQYKSELYPYRCDFYIPCEDLYIEYQGFKSHNYEPFEINNLKHQEKVKKWKEYSQYNKSYIGYLKVWTVTDPLKRQIVKDNNLNWLEFFNMKQFMDWYNKKEE